MASHPAERMAMASTFLASPSKDYTTPPDSRLAGSMMLATSETPLHSAGCMPPVVTRLFFANAIQ